MVSAEVETSWHDLERSGTVGNSRRVDLLASGSPAFGHGDAEAVGRHGGERVPRGRGLVFPDDFRGEARERLGPSAGRHTGRASRRNWRRVAGPRFRKSRLHAVEIETRQLAAHVAGVRAGRPPRSRLLAPSRRRRPRLADGRSPEGTREGVTGRARLGRREDGARHHGSGRVLRQRRPEALPGRGRVSAEDAGAKR